ncbi:MAG: DUF1127 domain-containing protein [Pseudomonas sp.]|uniref:DUF1127 domain-containing protein n=1 Tax=Pseudomonas sp. TaxID=306 RepID=UPI0027346C6F|nr:DUF1127 domain-containing protein [Pseudomonas sp.]MDP3846739.1 DUF1127 domain-containing protein [Pseudomonas sp.]
MHRSAVTETDRAEYSLVASRTACAVRLLVRLQLWLQNSRTRRQLAQLDARQLADAGITHVERDAELDKPFWR